MKCLKLYFLMFNFLGISFMAAQEEPKSGDFPDYNNINMPDSPVPHEFQIMGGTQVNISKGTPIIQIPLYTYILDGVAVPISISYDASGVRVDQMASSVGLGWSLEAGGSINRTVRGWADEYPESWGWFNRGFLDDEFYAQNTDPNNLVWQQSMKGPSWDPKKGLAYLVDHNPDIFNYSFLGKNGTFIHDTETALIKEQEDGIYFDSYLNLGDIVSAKDLEGNKYFFNPLDNEKSNNSYISGYEDLESRNWDNELGFSPVTSFKLSQILTKNDKAINFAYDNYIINYSQNRPSSTITIGSDCNDDFRYPLMPIKKVSYTNTIYDIQSKRIKKISSPHSNVQVDFIYEQDTGLPDDVQATRLVQIIISDPTAQNYKKSYHFSYGRFGGNPRLKLISVQESVWQDANVHFKPPHQFQYGNDYLPKKDSKSTDFYGYYNGYSNGTNSVPHMEIITHQAFMDTNSANRNLNANVIQNGILNKIIYPTGGTTKFFYEPNVSENKYYGGLRVSKIEDQSETGIYNERHFEYQQAFGKSLGDNLNYYIKQQGAARSFHSSPIRQAGDLTESYKSGYFYGKVIIKTMGDDDTYKNEYYYEDNENNLQSYQPIIKAEYLKNANNQLVKIVEYQNQKIGNGVIFEWNTLGDMICYYYPSRFRSIWPGYSTSPRKVRFSGNYAYLPTQISTTEFLKRGNVTESLTVVKEISYDPATLLKKREITDFGRKRVENGGVVSYLSNDNKAERITVDYTYPFDVIDFNALPNFPKSTVVLQEITTTKDNISTQTGGRAFAFDNSGNIKTIYEFGKSTGSNTSSLSYVPPSYEERTNFIFKNGFPTQVQSYQGSPTSYIWNSKGSVPVAKIVGLNINIIPQNLITPLEQASFDQFPGLLGTLRTTLLNQNLPVMLTTFTYSPLLGVTSITDPKGEKTTFEYDFFGRLKAVRDSEGKILTENEYKYALD